MRIFLARHGETDWNVRKCLQGCTDTELNENGLRQARELAEKLVGSGISCVYTSRLQRAMITGQTVADRLGIPCYQRDGLQEIGFGDWEGHTFEEVQRIWPDIVEKRRADIRNTRPPNGETYGEMIARTGRAVMDILAENRGDVLIVAHNGCIITLLAEIHGTPLNTAGKDYPMPNATYVELDIDLLKRHFAK